MVDPPLPPESEEDEHEYVEHVDVKVGSEDGGQQKRGGGRLKKLFSRQSSVRRRTTGAGDAVVSLRSIQAVCNSLAVDSVACASPNSFWIIVPTKRRNSQLASVPVDHLVAC